MISIISSLTTTELKLFQLKLSDNSLKKDTPLLALLNSYLNNSLDSFKHTLNSNSYYVYEKRLKEKLLYFLAERTLLLESTEEIKPLKLLIAARKLLVIGSNNEGIKTLQKAEKLAKKINHFGLLNEIYQTEIQYAFDLNEDQIMLLHEKLIINNKQFIEHEKLNLAYSLVKNSLKKDSATSNQIEINEIFKSAIKHFSVNKEATLNFKQIYQLVEVINIKAIQDKNFDETNLFFIDQLNKIINSPLDTIDSAPYHIKTLFAIANIQFRKKNFQESLEILNRIEIQLIRYQKLKPLFEYELNLLLALNYNFNGQFNKAAIVLDCFLETRLGEKSKSFNLILVRCMIHFQQDEVKQSSKLLSIINETDHWIKKNIGFEWLLNKKYLEILVHIELNNYELVDSRINSLLKSHKAYFIKNKSFQIIPFLRLVKQYIKNPQIVKTLKFSKLLENTIISKPNKNDDLFLICFYCWLKAKATNSQLYETTLTMISSNRQRE